MSFADSYVVLCEFSVFIYSAPPDRSLLCDIFHQFTDHGLILFLLSLNCVEHEQNGGVRTRTSIVLAIDELATALKSTS